MLDESYVSPTQRGLEPTESDNLLFAGNSDFNFLNLWKVIRRRYKLVQWMVIAFALAGLGYCYFVPRLYKAEAQLQLLKQDSAASLSDPAQASASAAADALDFNLTVQTQVDVMRSRNMALKVIKEVGLDREPEYQLDRVQASRIPLERSPKHLAFALTTFGKRLQINAVSGTRLISVSFLDPNATRAAQVVNQIIADYIEYTYQIRFLANSQATTFLSDQLQNMKLQVDDAQANVARLQQQSGIYGVDEANNSVNAKLEQLNTQVTAAQANKAVKDSIYKMALTRSPDVLAGMIGAQGTGANTANAPLQLLRQQQADAASSYAELNERYGSEYPKVLQAGEKLRSIQTSIRSEIDRLVGQAKAEDQVASDAEAAASHALQVQEGLAAKMNHDATVYTSARHEADSSRDIYEGLLKRMKEANMLAGLHSTNLNVLDPAITPPKLAQPLVATYLLIFMASGLFWGIFAAFTADAMDGSVRDPQQVEDETGTSVLALIPPVERALPKPVITSLRNEIRTDAWQYLTTAKAPRSIIAESFRVLRTSVLSAMPGKQPRVIAITSTSEGEGKTFITFNLAAAFAQSGRRVLVIDADLRKRSLSLALGREESNGLEEAVADKTWQTHITTFEEVPGLFLLPAGQLSHYPADVLGSVSMANLIRHLRNSFDIILIDTPSILAVTDTVSLSTSVDGLLLVAKSGVTARHSLIRTVSVLKRSKARLLGVVVNGIDYESSDFYYYWGKQSTGYRPAPSQILSLSTNMATRRVATILFFVILSVTAASHLCFGQTAVQPPEPIAGPLPHAGASQQKVLIGPGDLLTISVYDAPELSQDVRVGFDGTTHLILLGDVQATGLQPEQFAARMEKELSSRNLIRSPHVSAAIKEFTTQGVTVEGEVKKPGLYPIFATRSLVDVIALAEGMTSAADTHVAIHRFATGTTEHVTLSQDNGTEVIHSDVRVFPGDTVIVPRASFAYVLGDVQKPGGYMMRDNGSMTVLQAISEAQGTTRIASLKHVILLRKNGSNTETIPVQLKAIQRGQEPDRPLQNGDILFVPTSGIKSFGQDTAGIFASLSGAALYSVH